MADSAALRLFAKIPAQRLPAIMQRISAPGIYAACLTEQALREG
jgi:hypothetical protein